MNILYSCTAYMFMKKKSNTYIDYTYIPYI